MKIKELLNEEIEAELESLNRMTDVCSDSYKATVDSIAKLADRAIELEKIEASRAEAELKVMASKTEAQLKLNAETEQKRMEIRAEAEQKQKELDDKKKDRIVNGVIAGAGIALPLGVTVWGAIKSFEFEKEGSITTLIGRGFMNKLLKK